MVMDAIFSAGKRIVDIALAPIEDIGTNEGLREKNLRAFLENQGAGSLLLYRYYEEFDDIGVYTLADGRHGLIYRVFPPAFLGEAMEEQIYSVIESIGIDGAVLQFITFSSQNIDSQIDDFIRAHPCETNVRNRKALKELVKTRGEYLRQKAREGMFKNLDMRLRDFHNLVCVIFPEGFPKEDVLEHYESIKATFGKMPAENYPADKLVTLLREFLHNEKGSEDWNSNYDHMMAMNHQIVSGGVDIKTNVKEKGINFSINDANYVTVLTTQEYPQLIGLEEMNELFFDRWGTEIKPPISGPFIASLTIVYDQVERAKQRALAKQRHDLGELRKTPMKVVEANPDLKDRRTEAKQHVEFIVKHNEVPLRSMWSLILFDRDKRKLKQSVGGIKNRFFKKGWSLVEESNGNVALIEALYSLPLQYRQEVDVFLKRFFTLFKSNNAGIAPLIGDNRGFGYAHMPIMGRTGQLQWFDPYASDTNYNIAAIGSSGSGKSFTMSDFLVMGAAKNGKIRVIDSLDSYKRVTEVIGGEYFNFDDKTPVCLNFFTKILTKRDDEGREVCKITEDGKRIPMIAEEEMASIIPIIGMMCGVNVVAAGSEIASDINTSTSTRYLAAVFEEAVRAAFESQGRSAGMEEVRNYLIEKRDAEKKSGMADASELLNRVTVALAPYAEPGGVYYSYFNGVNNMNFEMDFAVVEISKLEAKGQLFPIVLMTIANQIVNEFFGEAERYKVLLIDEFFKFKDNVIVATFTEELARKVRKMKGLLVTVTQTLNDYAANPRVQALYDSSAWKFLLSQPSDAISRAVAENRLPFGAFFGNLLKTVGVREGYFGEFAIASEKAYMVSRLKTDTLALWLYSTKPYHKDAIRSAMNRHGIGEVEAAKLCAYKQDHPGVDDIAALEAIGVIDKDGAQEKERKEKERKAKIKKTIEMAIKKKNPVLYRQPILDRDGKVVKYEVVTRLKDESGSEIRPADFLEVAKEEGLLTDLDRVITDKAIDIMSYEKLPFGVNVSVVSFLDKTFVEELLAKAIKQGAIDYMTIEVPLRELKPEQFEAARAHAEIVKKRGAKFSNDNIDFDLPPRYLAGMPLDFVKINGSITKQLKEDKLARNFAEVTIASAKRMGMRVCFLHIETEEEHALCTEIGGELFQGDYLGGVEKVG